MRCYDSTHSVSVYVHVYMCTLCKLILYMLYFCRMKNLTMLQMVYGRVKDILAQSLVEESLCLCCS